MEAAHEGQSADEVKKTPSLESGKQPSAVSADGVKRVLKGVKPTGVSPALKDRGTVASVRKSADAAPRAVGLSSSKTRPTLSSSTSMPRRSSTGGLPEKQQSAKRPDNSMSSGRKVTPSLSDNGRRTAEIRRVSLTSASSRLVSAEVRLEPKPPVPRFSSRSDVSKGDSTKKPAVKMSPSASSSKVSSDSSNGLNVLRRSASSGSSPSARSPSVTSSLKLASQSSSADKGSSVSGRKKTSTQESRDSRFIMLPQVDVKAGDELRLDLRGHRVRSLGALNLSPNLEFVYLRDNMLSSVERIEILKRVKVLDLSFNDFKEPGFEPLGTCLALQQLYLAGNQIVSLASLPQLPNLEFLSVAQNKLKSLSMASQPRLQVLAASKNKVSTLKDFPYLPVLEHLRVEENPILEMPHLEAASILLVGPTLKRFNDRDPSADEIEISKLYPAHTALCIRDGWQLCRPELAIDSTFSFLLEQWKDHLPPGYMLKEAFIDQPFEEDACRCHFNFINLSSDSKLMLKYQWFIGDKIPTNFMAIADAVGEIYWPKPEDIDKFLKVECSPVMEETEYPSVFALSSPVSPGTGYPKVLNVSVQGELVEGNMIKGIAEVAWCSGTPGKGVASWLRRKWNSSPVVIVAAEDEEYLLTVDDIDSSLVFMYTPVTEEGTKGEPQYALTEFVKAAAPSVSNVQVIGDIVEGNTIKGIGDYFGGKEGPSRFEWLRESKETGVFALASSGTTEYTLTKEDVGKRLVFVYVPLNFEGQDGESASVITDIVKQAPPKVINLKILGDLREGIKVTVSAAVTGGSEGSSRVQWFKTRSSTLEDESSLEAVSTSKVSKAFRVPLAAVGYYIVAKFTPVASGGESGEPAYVICEKVVEIVFPFQINDLDGPIYRSDNGKTILLPTLPPSLSFLTVTGDYSEGEMLTASYGYIGGHEGNSLYNWCLHETETNTGALIREASGLLQYRITKDAVGKFVSFKCTPVRDDGTVGVPRLSMGQERVCPGSPRLLSLRIFGNGVEGTILHADKKYWGGEEGDSIFHWFLTSSDGTQTEIKGTTTASYTLTCADIGFCVSVSCEPVRSDWARGPIVVSERIGPIIPGPPTCQSLNFLGSMVEGERLTCIAAYSGGERGNCSYQWFRVKNNGTKNKLSNDEFLYLTIEDVDNCIELLYTPVRTDGVRGPPKSIMSSVILPANPKGVELSIPHCSEDKEVIPVKSYYGGKEGTGEYVWYRIKEKLKDSDLFNIDMISEGSTAVGKNLTYSPSLEDVGCHLALYWVPKRVDGIVGDPLAAISDHTVMAAPPIVSDVRIMELGSDICAGDGKYYGGCEGSSLYSWYRQINDGTITIDGANSTKYEVTDLDYNYRLLFGYTPVRSDNVVGEIQLSEPSEIILPEFPKIEMLFFNGQEVEGEVLTAVEQIPKSHIQQNIWSKYKKEIKYKWFFSAGTGEYQSFELLPSHDSCSYGVRLEDIGRCLKCECIVTDVFGRSSDPVSAVTAPIIPGIPKINKLEIEGRGFHTNLYDVCGIYRGGKEGKSKIQWLRSMDGSPDLISIPGEVGRMYEANVDDVGYRLVAVYTPVREDGIEGQPVSASTEPIAVEPDVYKEVKQKLELGSVKFEEVEGEVLTAVEQIPKSHIQQNIWSKYKKEIKYKWFFSAGTGEYQSFELLPSHDSCSYGVRLEDIGRCLKCECIVTDVFGRSSDPVSAVTAPIIPGIPKINKLEIEGRGFHTNLYDVCGIYRGGKEGKSKIQWLRSMDGSPDLISIPGEVGRMYEANVDDVGYRLVAVYTPVREDGIEGQPVSASTEPIAVEPDVYKEVKQKLELGSVKFEALCDKDGTSKKVPGVGNLERRLLEVNRKRVKVVKPGSKTSFPTTEIRGSYAPPFHVELYRNDQHLFKIVVDGDNEVDLMVQTRYMRDVIVLVIRGFAQRFNSTSLNSLLKIGT